MNHSSLHRPLVRALFTVAIFGLPTLAQTPTITSTFDTDNEGWEIVNMALYSHKPAYVGIPTIWSTAGNPGGCLEVFDNYYFTGISAPASWLGDRRAYFGGSIDFDLKEWETTASWVQPGAALVSTNHTLYYPTPVPPPDQWVSQSFSITPGAWRFDDSTGLVATQSQMLEVLSDLQAIWIATEWRSGTDDTFVDNIALVPPAHGSVAIYGSGLNPTGSLTVLSGNAQLGTVLTLGVDNPLGTQAAGSLSFVAVSVGTAPGFPIGIPLSGYGMAAPGSVGELLIHAGTLVVPIQLGAPWTGPGQPAPVVLHIPALPGLAGLTLYAQGALLDTAASWIGLTEAAMLVLGS